MNKKIIVYVSVGIVVLIGIFYLGVFYGKSRSQMKPAGEFGIGMQQNQNGQFGMKNGNGKMNEGGMIGGEITSMDDKSITIKLTNGGSKIVFFDTNTVISKMATGSTSDLSVSTSVSVTGSANSDGSLTAKSIEIRPQIKTTTPPTKQ
jgi:hypothetical protein